ncbi:MAG: GNAT family N-acetyltransferase [Pseudomonadota bacterium]
MKIEIIETPARLIEIELDWDELYKRDPFANIYLSSRFISSVVARLTSQFRILIAWSGGGTCIGALPLFIKTRWSKSQSCLYNEIDMLGRAFDGDYTGILCDPDHETDVCQAFASEVTKMPFGRMVLSFFNGPLQRLETFCRSFDPAHFVAEHCERKINDGKTDNLICPYVDLPNTYDAYLEGLSANSRQKLRRLLRDIDSNAGLRVTRSRPETFEQDAAILAELWFIQYAERKGIKRAAQIKANFRENIIIGLANGLIYLPILWLEGKPVAAQANYVDPVKRHVHFHVGARDETISSLATGLMLQAHSIRWAVANGMTRYDFTLGNEPYKYSFGAIDRQIGCVEITSKGGINPSGILDPICRAEAAEAIRSFVTRGRVDDARTAARQALNVWPELEEAGHVETLIANADKR